MYFFSPASTLKVTTSLVIVVVVAYFPGGTSRKKTPRGTAVPTFSPFCKLLLSPPWNVGYPVRRHRKIQVLRDATASDKDERRNSHQPAFIVKQSPATGSRRDRRARLQWR